MRMLALLGQHIGVVTKALKYFQNISQPILEGSVLSEYFRRDIVLLQKYCQNILEKIAKIRQYNSSRKTSLWNVILNFTVHFIRAKSVSLKKKKTFLVLKTNGSGQRIILWLNISLQVTLSEHNFAESLFD